jgi:hypothetical protein
MEERLHAGKPWHLTACVTLPWRDRWRVLLGVPIFVRFVSPDGACHAACSIEHVVQRDWPIGKESTR